MSGFFAGLGRFAVRFRFLIVVAWLALIAVTTVAFPSLGSEVNNDNSQFLPASAPSSRAAALAAPLLGSINDNSEVTVIAARRSGALDASDLAALTRVAAAVRRVPRVSSVQELGASPDDQAIQIEVRARVNQADIARQKTLIDALQGALNRVRAPADLEVRL